MTNNNAWWRRGDEGLGVWPHRGKVAIAGWGHSPVDRRWDGVSMDRTLGAFAIRAAQQALEDAGISPEEVDGLLCCPESMAGANSGSAARWAPRPYFEPPYDSEDGLTVVTGGWLAKNMPGLTNLKYNPERVPAIGEQMGMAAQSVAEGLCEVALVVYGGANLEGRYRMGGENEVAFVGGENQWGSPWGVGGDPMAPLGGPIFSANVAIQLYCQQYGVTWDDLLGPFVVNQHRNGLMNKWSYYALNEPSLLALEDYADSRPIIWPVRIWDCDRPVNAVSAYVFTTAERARSMKQKPVYVLSHSGSNPVRGAARSTVPTLEATEESYARTARIVYEGGGLRPEDVDVLNPYDGFSMFGPLWLEAFGWHGVQKGDAAHFFQEDIRVEGPHPFSSGGGNLGNGRTRSAMFVDSIEQLRGSAGQRQVQTRHEVAVCGYLTSFLCLSTEPN